MLISKKDLLTETNISYGQLYRWKREGLIPEEWFIKQPSFTGQETFFPKIKILNRVKAIQELKDKYSLEELAKILSPEVSERYFTVLDLNIIDEIEKCLIPYFCSCFQKESFSFLEVIFFISISDCKRRFSLSLYDIECICEGMKDNFSSIKLNDYMFVLLYINKAYYVTLYSESSQICFDKRFNILCQIRLNDISSKMKVKYRKSFNFKFDSETDVFPFELNEGLAVFV